MSTNNGGPAFPHPTPVGAWGDPSQGMTLRDYFAAKALPALITGDCARGAKPATADAYANSAYALAEAMLKAREA